MSLQSSLFIATDRRSKKLGIPSLEAPRIPLWQSKRSGVFLSLKSQPLINPLSNHSPQLLIRMVFRPIQRLHVVGFVLVWSWQGQDSSTRLDWWGYIGNYRWDMWGRRVLWVGILGIFYYFSKIIDRVWFVWPGYYKRIGSQLCGVDQAWVLGFMWALELGPDLSFIG